MTTTQYNYNWFVITFRTHNAFLVTETHTYSHVSRTHSHTHGSHVQHAALLSRSSSHVDMHSHIPCHESAYKQVTHPVSGQMDG
jgi:hypothetical protein